MTFSVGNFVGLVIRLFVLLSPFCTLSLFLSCSGDMTEKEQRGFALRISLAIWVICILFYLFGRRSSAFWASRSTPSAWGRGWCCF